MPSRARHGTPIRITAEEYVAVMKEYGSAETVEMVTFNGVTPELPETVVMQGTGEEKAVTWNIEGVSFDVNPYKYVTVTGTVEGCKYPATAKVQVIPENVEYMIDCNNTGSESWKNAAANSAYMLNVDAADQAKTDDNTWGYVSIIGTDMEPYSQNDVSNPYAGGYWAKGNKNISYQVTLPAGEHTVMLGCTGWWSMGRQMDVFYTINDGEEVKLCDFDAVRSSERYSQGTITLEEEAVVTLTVKKAANDDGILSWISITGIPTVVEVELDYTALHEIIEEAEALEAELYTEESFADVEAALEAAKALVENAETQEEINEAVTTLQAAINALEEVEEEPTPVVDKTELQNLYDSSKEISKEGYTEESYKAFEDALAEAKAVLENEEATQDDVSAAYSKLYDAVKALEKASDDDQDEDKPSVDDGKDEDTEKAPEEGGAETGDSTSIVPFISLAAAMMVILFIMKKRVVK